MKNNDIVSRFLLMGLNKFGTLLIPYSSSKFGSDLICVCFLWHRLLVPKVIITKKATNNQVSRFFYVLNSELLFIIFVF